VAGGETTGFALCSVSRPTQPVRALRPSIRSSNLIAGRKACSVFLMPAASIMRSLASFTKTSRDDADGRIKHGEARYKYEADRHVIMGGPLSRAPDA
jgi:hypothetical protein